MNKQILRLAIPNIISNLSVPLLSSIDTALVGHLEQIHYLGALAVGGIIFNFVYWGFGFLRMGTTGLTAQAYGNNDHREVSLTLIRTLLIALGGGLSLIFLQEAIAAISFFLITATPEVEKYARQYFYIRIYAAPATLALYAFHGWFLGMQNAKYPLILTVLVNILNIIFNLLFIYKLGMKIDGVAYGTLISQYLGLCAAVILYFKKYSLYSLKATKAQILERLALRRIFTVNIDILIRTLCLIFTFSYFTAMSAKHGETVLAVNTILLQFITILAYGVDGFAFASESLVGKYIGARDRRNLRKTVNYSFVWGVGLGVVIALVYVSFDEAILRIFTNKDRIIELAMIYMVWIAIAPLINSFAFIWDGIFIGATATAPMRNSMIFCTFGVFLPTYLLLKDALGNHSLWLALTLFMLLRGVTLTWYSRKHIFQEI